MSATDSEKHGIAAADVQHADYAHGGPRKGGHDSHNDLMAEGATAEGTAEHMMQVDDKRAAQLREELSESRQAGWRPISDEEKKLNSALNRKLDWMILPIVALGYMFNQLDRTNLGNAQTANFSNDLGIPAAAVNNASSLFFATYIPFQPFAAALGRRLGAPRFLGCTLCGFYPTVLSYLTDFYPRYECAFRFALFYGFFSVAGAFGGLIAFGILQANGALHPWQYLFIIEGAVPVLLGLITPFWLANDVRTAWFLKPEERAFAERRMIIDSVENAGHAHKVTLQDFKEAFIDWRVWGIMISNMLASLASQGFTVFFPVVVKGLGYTEGSLANLMTVPPYVAGAIGVWGFAWSSDRFRERTYHQLAGMTIVILGLVLTIVIPLDNIGGRYAGLMVLMFGAFIHAPIAVAWLAGNTPDPGKRAVCIGISGWANLAGIIGTQLFKPQYGPSYIFPLQVTVGLISVGWAGFAAVGVGLRLVNRWRYKKIQSMTPEQIEEENRSDTRKGDRKWTFVYGV
ncbi:major facilitator superfamily domain-containing protein [Microdochium trichocladiopsis]|uniref:Major facilitator superfamily domain-containing protein n=1 Tax=Microdochium trichocladiopsis TaxID=1682393 RepID=A0A9P9BQ50_9PEZI|nr:major facilitator superfamily domain-containing protein [Microdochium trichocladiopsis]KAH7030572.1 major facilitator superfamily domain-containing protein [Microdochium trichocladiopsis]